MTASAEHGHNVTLGTGCRLAAKGGQFGLSLGRLLSKGGMMKPALPLRVASGLKRAAPPDTRSES